MAGRDIHSYRRWLKVAEERKNDSRFKTLEEIKKMTDRDYEGWKRYGEWKKQNYENYQKQMSDGKTEALKGIYAKNKTKNIEQMPDQKWHKRISFIKSGIRIIGYSFIPFNLITATVLLTLSEVVGIIEELV